MSKYRYDNKVPTDQEVTTSTETSGKHSKEKPVKRSKRPPRRSSAPPRR